MASEEFSRHSPVVREREPEVGRPPEETSIASLFGDMIGDAQQLVRKEFELAKYEIRGEVDKAKDGAISLAIGAAIAVVGAFLLIQMVVQLLIDLANLAPWLAYLIVGAPLALVGFFLLQRGSSRVQEVDPVPHETIENVRKDVAWIKDQNPSSEK